MEIENKLFEELDSEQRKALVREIVDKKNGMSDKDWSELCDEYGLTVSPETLRKAGVGVKLVSDSGLLVPPFRPQREETGYTERQKLRDLTSKYNAFMRTQSRSELLRETVKEAIKALPEIKTPDFTPRPKERDEEKELVLALGDFHYGADINVVGLHGETINKYNSKVFEDRLNELGAEVTDIVNKEHPNRIRIMIVGDLIDGILRQSQLMRLEYGMVDSVIKLSEILSVFLSNLSILCDVTVSMVSGNHSEIRPLGSKHREFEEENLERIISWFLESRLHDNHYITVNPECNRMCLVDVLGWKFLLLHGDGDKKITDIAKETINLYDEKIDFFVCGHKHREEEFPLGMTGSGNSAVIRVPSFCGVDTYAQSKGYGGRAGAIAIIMEKNYGRRVVYPLVFT